MCWTSLQIRLAMRCSTSGGKRNQSAVMASTLSTMRRAGLAYEELTPAEQELVHESYAPIVVGYPDRASLSVDHERIRLHHHDVPRL